RILGALRELAFEHEAGHISDDDHAELRARYEVEAAAVLTALDRLTPAEPPAPLAPASTSSRRPAWSHPVVVAAGAVGLVVFGIVLGAGGVRNTAPDPMAGQAPAGPRPAGGHGPALAPRRRVGAGRRLATTGGDPGGLAGYAAGRAGQPLRGTLRRGHQRVPGGPQA